MERMRLCAIFNCWDDWQLLELSAANIKPHVDGIIIVASTMSNYGEFSPIPYRLPGDYIVVEPVSGSRAMENETMKRNAGISYALACGFTHFITMDADEFYTGEAIQKGISEFESDPSLQGIVCSVRCYFGSPDLTIGLDTTLVPFIHKLTPSIQHAFNRNYPYAWIDRQIRIDPTRSLNIDQGVIFMPEITMEHFSWVRPDFEKKIRNSTARANIERSTILSDLRNAKEGYFCQFYGKTLTRATVDFGIPYFPAKKDDPAENLQPD